MPNNIYRDRIINKIDYAVKEAKNAAQVNHAGLTGRIREIAISSVFQPMLPSGFEIGTGKICDRAGKLSSETDLIVYQSVSQLPSWRVGTLTISTVAFTQSPPKPLEASVSRSCAQ